MDGNVCIVEQRRLAILNKREVVAVDFCRNATWQFHMPVLAFDVYDIDVIALLVKEGVDSLC